MVADDVPFELANRCLYGAGLCLRWWDGVREIMTRLDTVKAVQSLTVPILFIVGSKDFRKHEKELLAAAPQGTLEVIEGAGHVAPLSHAEDFNKRVERFLLKHNLTSAPLS